MAQLFELTMALELHVISAIIITYTTLAIIIINVEAEES